MEEETNTPLGLRAFCYKLEYHPAIIIVAEDREQADAKARLHGAIFPEQYIGELEFKPKETPKPLS